ncbi:MAG: NADPH-dependent FMN reductase, partial [Dokdonella sp.]
RKLARALIEIAPSSLQLEIVEIGDLPLYNADYEDSGVPPSYAAFRERVGRAEGVVFVTPEYNRSLSGALKNAIDVGSRPYETSVWTRKPAAVLSASTGAMGGFGANHHLRQSLVFLDMPAMQQPEGYIGGADKLFDEAGKLTNDSTRRFLDKFVQAYAAWLERNVAT